MVRIILIICLLAGSTLLSKAQEYDDLIKPVRTELKNINNIIYNIEYYADGDIFMFDSNNPFSGVENGSDWQSKFIATSNTDVYDIVSNSIVPHIKDKNISFSDDMFYLRIYYDLNGNVRYNIFGFESNVGIPFEAIAELDTALKTQYKLTLSYNPERVKDIHYINITLTPSITALIRDYKPPGKPDINTVEIEHPQ